jgi:hypothetical protein
MQATHRIQAGYGVKKRKITTNKEEKTGREKRKIYQKRGKKRNNVTERRRRAEGEREREREREK